VTVRGNDDLRLEIRLDGRRSAIRGRR
jgi:hypothetical protein